MAASNESQKVCHASGSPENCGKLSFGSLVEFPNPSFVRCACRVLLTLVLLSADGTSALVTATFVGASGVSSPWSSNSCSPSGRVTVLEVSVSLEWSVTVAWLGVDDDIGGVVSLAAESVASGGDRGSGAGVTIAWL